MTDYRELDLKLRSLICGVPHPIANLANAASLLYNTLENINWAGFYILKGEILALGPFCGKPACIEIPVGRGVCGTAVQKNDTIVVPDVHAFSGHIACDADSRSEIVIPIRCGGEAVAVLDIDSPAVGRFDEADKRGLKDFVKVIEEEVCASRGDYLHLAESV